MIDFEGVGIDFEGVGGGEPGWVRARHTGMSHGHYGRGMHPTRSGKLAGFIVVAALTIAGCGGSSVSVSTDDSPTASSSGSDSPSDSASTSALVVTRTGGIAGVLDMVRIAADGSATITSKAGKGGACTPSGTALDRLRAIDLAAVQASPTKPTGMADGFNYSVKSGSGSAAASEGDDDSRRVELVDAAAAVVATCLATRS